MPGHYVTHPNDYELYHYAMTEGAPDQGVYQLAPYGWGQAWDRDRLSPVQPAIGAMLSAGSGERFSRGSMQAWAADSQCGADDGTPAVVIQLRCLPPGWLSASAGARVSDAAFHPIRAIRCLAVRRRRKSRPQTILESVPSRYRQPCSGWASNPPRPSGGVQPQVIKRFRNRPGEIASLVGGLSRTLDVSFSTTECR